MMYASIRHNPKTRSRFGRDFDRKPVLTPPDKPPVWHEDSWSTSRALGESNSRPYHLTHEGVGWGGQAYYDVRIVSQEDETAFAAIDAQITELQKQKHQLLEDRFRTWRLATKEDCEGVIPGRTLKEATALAKAEGPVGAKNVAQERRLLAGFTQALTT